MRVGTDKTEDKIKKVPGKDLYHRHSNAIMDHRIFLLTILMMAMVLMAGCTSQNGTVVPEKKTPDPIGTTEAIAKETTDMTSPDSTGITSQMDENSSETMKGFRTEAHETVPLNNTIEIYLKENPTTGYMWNASVSSGLKIENDTYVADRVKPGVVGSGGTHYWLVKGTQKGNQTFDAVYKRPWEPETGNETRYTMDITVV